MSRVGNLVRRLEDRLSRRLWKNISFNLWCILHDSLESSPREDIKSDITRKLKNEKNRSK